MKTTILAVIAGIAGLQALFNSRTLAMLLGKNSRKYLKYPHTSL
jgi:hypothetical protein